MTRPLIAAALAVVAAACGNGEKSQLARTESLRANAAQPDPRRWCDVFYTETEAPRLVLPSVEPARLGETVPVLHAGRWVWLNVWATWCGPCRREMPLLLCWREQLVKEGTPLDLWFLSVDERPKELAQFLRDNPSVAPGSSVRLAAAGELGPWLAGFKGAPTGSIPLQVIAGPNGAVRCIRAGSLRDGDFPVVQALVGR